MKNTNEVWRELLKSVMTEYNYKSKPRGMEVKEILNGHYTVKMPAYLTLEERKVNYSFMFAEAAWILSGSNRVKEIVPYMKTYKNFSDDGIFLNGAYGPKVVDQLRYVIDALEKDNDTRQAVLTIWRERPSESKDIPCTVAMQFFIRRKKLHSVVTMRSNDVVLGFTYDVFTFSMVTMAVQKLLAQRGLPVALGNLNINAGSLHIYEKHFKDAIEWYGSETEDNLIDIEIQRLKNTTSYDSLIRLLWELADDYQNKL